VQREPAAALATAQQAFRQGVDAGELAAQLLGFFRDCLAASAGCDDELLMHASPDQFARVRELGANIGLEHSLAIAQLLDECLVKMRASSHPQILLEVGIVRICRLEKLQAISDLIEQLRGNPSGPSRAPPDIGRPAASSASPASASATPSTPNQAGRPAAGASSKKNELTDLSAAYQQELEGRASLQPARLDAPTPAAVSVTASPAPSQITSSNVESVWRRALDLLGDSTADMARSFQRLEWAPDGRIVVTLSEQFQRYCSLPERKSRVENSLAEVAGQPIRVEFVAGSRTDAPSDVVPTSRLKRIRDSARDPLVRTAIDLFDATIVDASRGRASGQS
jgi:DNA polymerase-3 subunit gamma/tau